MIPARGADLKERIVDYYATCISDADYYKKKRFQGICQFLS